MGAILNKKKVFKKSCSFKKNVSKLNKPINSTKNNGFEILTKDYILKERCNAYEFLF